MTKRRSRTERIYEILESINKGVEKPTNILYDTNVSWNVLQEILDLLKIKKYIKAHRLSEASKKKRVKYYLTDEGQTVLSNMRFLENTLQI